MQMRSSFLALRLLSTFSGAAAVVGCGAESADTQALHGAPAASRGGATAPSFAFGGRSGAATPGGTATGASGTAPAGACAPGDTFSYALCTCDNLVDVGEMWVGDGPSGKGSVGVNGNTVLVNRMDVSGNVFTQGEYHSTTDAHIGGTLHVDRNASTVGRLSVRGDLAVGGVFTSVGPVDVGGVWRMGGPNVRIGRTSGQDGPFAPLTHPPCGCGQARFDVAAAVARAATDNDNGKQRIDLGRMVSVGQTTVSLPSGRYHFDDAVLVGKVHFIIDGNVSLFVSGNLVSVGPERFDIKPGATLDLYVSGTITKVGLLSAGNPSDPSAFRLYIGGGADVMVDVGVQTFFGSIYAPDAKIVLVGRTEVVGSLMAGHLVAVGGLAIKYAGARPATCEPPPAQTPTPSPTPSNPTPAPTEPTPAPAPTPAQPAPEPVP